MTERMRDMLEMYGECVTEKKAAEIINCHYRTIGVMLKDGRLRSCCGGTKVDVRSICEYIEMPDAFNRAARVLKARQKMGIDCDWVV